MAGNARMLRSPHDSPHDSPFGQGSRGARWGRPVEPTCRRAETEPATRLSAAAGANLTEVWRDRFGWLLLASCATGRAPDDWRRKKLDEEERIRNSEIAERNRAEAQRLADEREAFERQQREAREAQERIDTARRRQEAEEQAKRDAEAEAARIAAAQAEAEAIRAAQAPDREKVAAWAKVVRGSLAPCPVVDSPAVREQMLTARIAVEEVLNRLEREMLEA